MRGDFRSQLPLGPFPVVQGRLYSLGGLLILEAPASSDWLGGGRYVCWVLHASLLERARAVGIPTACESTCQTILVNF